MVVVLMATYPAVLLSLPFRAVVVDLSTRCAVGKLEKAGKHAVDLCSVREDWVLEVHSMRDNIVVLIHPENSSRCTQTQIECVKFEQQEIMY